jgi:hypothetical protein
MIISTLFTDICKDPQNTHRIASTSSAAGLERFGSKFATSIVWDAPTGSLCKFKAYVRGFILFNFVCGLARVDWVNTTELGDGTKCAKL